MTAKVPRWDWLGEPLPVDVANTVRRDGAAYQEMWRTGADVLSWAEHEHDRVPSLTATETDDRLAELRRMRDDVFAVLRAVTRAEPYPPDAADRIDAHARAHPVVGQLTSPRPHVPDHMHGVEALLALITHAVIEFTARPEAERLALCDAPSCGQFFLRGRRDQRWCGTACGTRARVARHAAR